MTTVALMEHAMALEGEIVRTFPRVEMVLPLVLEALAFVHSHRYSPHMLENSGLLEQLVHAAHICKNRRLMEHDEWDDLSNRLKSFLDSVQEKFEKFHPNWEDGEVYKDWSALIDPCNGSDSEISDYGDSLQDVHQGFEWTYDRNVELEHNRIATEEYELFVSWLKETNRLEIYKEYQEHLLRLREDDKYAHVPIRILDALGSDHS
jgi:hypothetical protein